MIFMYRFNNMYKICVVCMGYPRAIEPLIEKVSLTEVISAVES